jgi:hypothetical protein
MTYNSERPILTRRLDLTAPLAFDWVAERKNRQLGEPIGHGKSEAEAIRDLEASEDEALLEQPIDVMDQIKRSRTRMSVLNTPDTYAAYRASVALVELIKIFRAYDREPRAANPVQRMREMWRRP